ncbi:MAG: anion permease [Syntrophomonadaceae bacterium]|nr:anion permease [Syntrophomonadaceae bacterium]
MVKWLITLIVPFLAFLIPQSAGVTWAMQVFFAITIWAILAWLLETVSETAVAIMLPVFYIIAGLGNPKVAFNPWTTTIPWIVLGGVIFSSVIITTGLAKRIAYFTILKTGGSFKGLLLGITLAGLIIAPFIPSAMGKMAVLTPIAIGICQALNLSVKSRAATAVMLTAFFAVTNPAFSYQTGGAHIVLASGVLSKITQQTITWSQYAYHNFILWIIWTFLCLGLVILLLKPDKQIEAKDVIKQKYDELGSMASQEKTVLALMGILIIALLTNTYHKIDPAWIFLLLCGVCFIPGINLLNHEKLSKVNFGIVLFVAGAMSIGDVGSAVGASKWIANGLFPYLTGGGDLHTLAAVWGFGVFLNFILTPLAATASFTGPLVEMALKAGISPLPVVYTFLQGLDQYLFPYEYALLLYVYSFGYISMKYMIKVLAPRMLLSLIFIVLIAYPYWKLIGIM